MYKNVIYVVNEVKGVTEQLRTSMDYNVVRDYAGNGKSFTKVSLTQENVPTLVITNHHEYEEKWVEIAGGQRRFKIQESTAIRIATNLYNRGITVILKDYWGTNINKVIIRPEDNIYQKIKEFCGIEDKATYKRTKELSAEITWESFTKIGENPYQIFKSKETFNKSLQMFTKYAEVYGLDHKNPVDMLTFLYIKQHKEIIEDYIDGTKFICPCCNSVVTVNGHERFVKGKLIKTGKTVCETCYTAYKVHDKRDVLRLAKYIANQK